MCSVTDEDFDYASDNLKFNVSIEDFLKVECAKCKSNDISVLLRKKDYYCKVCFLQNIEHKFRSLLGKNHFIRHNDNILIIYNGGHSTTFILHIINKILTEQNKKNLIKYNPYLLYINKSSILNISSEENEQYLRNIHKEIKSYNFPFYISQITNSKDVINFDKFENYKCLENNEFLSAFKKFKTLTAQQDYLKTCERNIAQHIGIHLNCKYIFTTELSNDLASNIISTIALGRGDHINYEVGLIDNRNDKIKILRPLREFTFEEITNYCKINNLEAIHIKNFGEDLGVFASINNLTNQFVENLQENFPATIHAVVRTSDKLLNLKNNNNQRCYQCDVPLHKDDTSALTALKAIELSKKISFCGINKSFDFSDSFDIDKTKNICHGCSLTLKES